MNTLVIEKLKKDDLKEAISIYDMNHNIKTILIEITFSKRIVFYILNDTLI